MLIFAADKLNINFLNFRNMNGIVKTALIAAAVCVVFSYFGLNEKIANK